MDVDKCAGCGRPMVRLPVTIGGQDLTMASCSNCDTRKWQRNGEVIDLSEVLDLTAEAAPRPSSSGRRARQT